MMLCERPHCPVSEQLTRADGVAHPERSDVGEAEPPQAVIPSKPCVQPRFGPLGRSMTMTSRAFRRHTGGAVSALVAAWLASNGPVAAADLYVLSAAAMQPVFKEIVGDFERMTEHKVVIRYANMGAAITRTLPDESADLVIGPRQLISDLVRQGRMRPDSQLTICKIGWGVPSETANAPTRSNDLQDYTVISAGIPRDAPETEVVSAFMAFLVSTKALAVMKAKGMEID